MGFLPVYAGVLTMGGETSAGGAASGSLLVLLCVLAQVLCTFLPPLLECYLALSVASCISSETGLSAVCRSTGKLLTQGLFLAGKLLAALLGLQRLSALQLDRTTIRAGKLLVGTVPIVGQALSDASETIFSAVQMLKSGLGLGYVPYNFARDALNAGEVFAIQLKEEIPTRHVVLVQDGGRVPNAAAREFARMLNSSVTQQDAP